MVVVGAGGVAEGPEINPSNPSAYTLTHTNTNICCGINSLVFRQPAGPSRSGSQLLEQHRDFWSRQAPSGQSGHCYIIHIALQQGVTDLFEPESYCRATASYEGQPVWFSLLKYHLSTMREQG